MMKKLLLISVMILGVFTLKAQWLPQATGFPEPSVGINYISTPSQNVAWATGYDGSGAGAVMQSFTKTNDGGNTWTAGTIPGFSANEPSMIFALDENTAWVPLFISTGGGALVKTSDGGATWVQQCTSAFPTPSGFPNIVHFWDANEGMTMGDPVGGYFEIWRTMDGGTNWERVPQANIPAILSGEFGVVGYYSVVGNTIWFGTNKGRVYKSIDKGVNWTVATTAFSGKYVDVDFLDQNHGIVRSMGDGTNAPTGQIAETFDGGTTWTAVTSTGTAYTNSIAWVPGLPNTLVRSGSATGAAGIAYSFDGGHTFVDFNSTSGTQFLYTAWFDNATGYAGGFTDATTPSTVGGMYKFTDVLTDILHIDVNKGDVVAYPNPSKGNFTFAIVGFSGVDVNISIYNTMGQKAYERNCNQNAISYNEDVDLSHLAKGNYVAQIQCGKKLMTKKLVIE